jgi:hypothetical protein
MSADTAPLALSSSSGRARPIIRHPLCGSVMLQMSTGRGPTRGTLVRIGLAVLAVVAVYILAVVLLVHP